MRFFTPALNLLMYFSPYGPPAPKDIRISLRRIMVCRVFVMWTCSEIWSNQLECHWKGLSWAPAASHGRLLWLFHFDFLFHHLQFSSHLFLPKFLLLLLDFESKLLLLLEFGSEFLLGLLTFTSLSLLQDLAQLGFHFQKRRICGLQVLFPLSHSSLRRYSAVDFLFLNCWHKVV